MGTKIEKANTLNKFDTIGIDLVAMNVNDLLAGGANPLFFMDYIALDKMDRLKCNTIIKGIGNNSPEMKALQKEIEEVKADLAREKENRQYDNLVHHKEIEQLLKKIRRL